MPSVKIIREQDHKVLLLDCPCYLSPRIFTLQNASSLVVCPPCLICWSVYLLYSHAPAPELEALQKQLDILTQLKSRHDARKGKNGEVDPNDPTRGHLSLPPPSRLPSKRSTARAENRRETGQRPQCWVTWGPQHTMHYDECQCKRPGEPMDEDNCTVQATGMSSW